MEEPEKNNTSNFQVKAFMKFKLQTNQIQSAISRFFIQKKKKQQHKKNNNIRPLTC